MNTINTTMTLNENNTYINLQFNDNLIIPLSISSFLYKNSNLLKSIDIDDDNNIPILCPSSYIMDENNICIFDDKTDLFFMFALLPDKFLEICKFLDIIYYENKDTLFSEQFIIYVMENIKEKINIIQYFMIHDIQCILQYNDNKNMVKYCSYQFYRLFLNEYKEEVIKYNRIDIYESLLNKSDFYRYIHKYDNHLTYNVKETQEYNDYIIKISDKLIDECKISNNMTEIKRLINCGAYVNWQDNNGYTALHFASNTKNNLEVVKYLVECGADVNLQSNYGCTILTNAIYQPNNLEVIKYLVEYGADINLQDNYDRTALYAAAKLENNLEVIKYLVEHGAILQLPNINCNTLLMNPSILHNNMKIIDDLQQFN